jgi:hypothetical protein
MTRKWQADEFLEKGAYGCDIFPPDPNMLVLISQAL